MSVVPQSEQKRKTDAPTKIVLGLVIIGFLMWLPSYFASQKSQSSSTNSTSGNSTQASAEASAKIEADKIKTETLSKIELLNPRIEMDIINMPELRVTMKNNTGKVVDGIVVAAKFKNNFGDPISGWGKDTFYGNDQETLKTGTSKNDTWSLTGFSNATKVSDIKVVRVHFADGTDVQDDSYANR